MRLTVCLEGNTEGRVLASVDMEEIAKMTITDDIEKSNFNPQMLKSCTDTSYQCGYQQGRADAIVEFEPLLKLLVDMESEYICDEMCGTDWCVENCKYNCPQKECYLKYLEQLKEQK